VKPVQAGDQASSYPRHLDADVVLRDGSTVRVRPVRAEDEDAIRDFLESLSDRTIYLRFFSGGVNLKNVARWAANVDYRNRFGLVALAGGRIIAHAMYVRDDDDRGDVGIEVADAYQARGLGTIMTGQLAEQASRQGIAAFVAEILPANRQMINLLRDSGFPLNTTSEPGIVRIEYPTSLTAEAVERFEQRERTAAVAAARRLLAPTSVAVVGAGRSRGTIGGELFHNLIANEFQGPVYPVNPKADVVQSVVAYPSVTAIPGPVDCAVIVVPGADVIGVARECATKGVGGLIVISAGFAEVGGDGVERQRELVEICREAGMRLIGPNCMGVINTAPDVRLGATFAPNFPPHGRVAFLSQSGGLGLAIIDHAAGLGLGLSSFVSIGNKADLSGNDLVQYWEQDDDTDVILLYLESFGNPRKFSRIARRVGKSKPIIAVKSGRSAAGARATSSHTGAMLAASDVTVDALFRQAGVIRTDTLAEMFDVTSVLSSQPPPCGTRVAIVGNAGGPGILCADACDAQGLTIAAFDDELRATLAAFLPGEAATGNPVDMIASATADDFGAVIDAIGNSGAVDAVISIFAPPLVTKAEDVARAIVDASGRLDPPIPVLSVFMGVAGSPAELREGARRVPAFAFPEEAARALARAASYGAWRDRPEGEVPAYPEAQRDEIATMFAEILAGGPRWLTPVETARVLDAYGVPFAAWTVAPSPSAAGRAARSLGGAVALKAVSPTLLHKSDAGGVQIGLLGAETVQRAATEMARRLGEAGHTVEGFLVQPMVESGVEMFVGVVHDGTFGPVVACGAGGTAIELLHDVNVRLAPLTDVDAREMIRGLATFPLLDGYRGAAKADVAGLEDLLLRVGAMVEEHQEIAEMDLNPVMTGPAGAVAVDARIRVEAPARRPPLGARFRL